MDPIATRRTLLGRLKDWDDNRSWQEFFDTYWRIIYSAARKAGLDDSAAQDVVQETVLSVARQMKGFQYDPAAGSFKGWLKLITQRRIADHFRKRHDRETRLVHRETRSTSVSPAEDLPDPQCAQEAVDAAWEAEWKQNLFDRAVEIVKQEINPRQFQIFDLHVIRKQPVSEVAAALGIRTAHVYVVKHRVTLLVRRTARRLEKAGR